MGFLNIYGTDALPAEQYGGHGLFTSFSLRLTIRLGWLGVVGTMVGVFGGAITILLLPFAVDYVDIPRHC
jgi:hypothetical protein